MKKRIFLLLLTAISLIASTSCNTVRGVGQDVERAGNDIQNSSR